MIQFLFEKSFTGEDIAEGVLVPMLEMILEELKFEMHSVHTRGASDMSGQPPGLDHFKKIWMGEPEFLESEGLSLGRFSQLPLETNGPMI